MEEIAQEVGHNQVSQSALGQTYADTAAEQNSEEKQVFEVPQPENAYSGVFAEVMRDLRRGLTDLALERAERWFEETAGGVLSIVALGEALEARAESVRAARVYGSLIDQFPSRAEMLRMTGERLERLGELGTPLATDAYENAVQERPDHPSGYRLLGYALLKSGNFDAAFKILHRGLVQKYPNDRFAGVQRILREDLALVGAVWSAAHPEQRETVDEALRRLRIHKESRPSTRFVLTWESDANDVDLHIFDGRHNHVYYERRDLASGGKLYADVTTGFGPECMTIRGNPRAYPYTIQAHYYSRGPMGYGMGKLQIVRHDGKGNLTFAERPFVIMNDDAYVNLGRLKRYGEMTTL